MLLLCMCKVGITVSVTSVYALQNACLTGTPKHAKKHTHTDHAWLSVCQLLPRKKR